MEAREERLHPALSGWSLLSLTRKEIAVMQTLRITPRELLLTMERLKADCRQMALDAKALWGSEETQSMPSVEYHLPLGTPNGLIYGAT